jgi:hypothetical protein
MAELIRWQIRARCSCGEILWTDAPMKTLCPCRASWVEADGTPGGEAVGLTDEEMVAALGDVRLERIGG